MTTTAPIHGQCDPRFTAVREAFADNFATRGEVGAAVCVYVEGTPVVDLWGGYANAARTRPWDQDTIVSVASTTKGMVALCTHMLVERGLLDLDAPVARYWPEFAQADKAQIPVRWLLSHRAGLPALRQDMPPQSLYDWHAFPRALAAEAPWWTPGTQHGYHALTFGYLVGEVIRRVSGKSVGQFFHTEVAGPLGADFFIGVPASEDARAAETLPDPPFRCRVFHAAWASCGCSMDCSSCAVQLWSQGSDNTLPLGSVGSVQRAATITKRPRRKQLRERPGGCRAARRRAL
jgi:CubicO group peptidase (beta-lactamase class C family)